MNGTQQKLWQKFDKHHEVILSVVLFSFMIPLIVLCYYAMPSPVDDYNFAYKTLTMGYWPSVQDWYLGWTGRYSLCMIMSANPLVWNSITGCKLLYLILIIWTPFAFYHFQRQIFVDRKDVLFYTAFSTFFYFMLLPSTNDGLYWMTGAAAYQLPILLSLHLVSILLRSMRTQHFTFSILFICLFLTFSIIGSNEISMLYVCLLVAGCTFLQRASADRWKWGTLMLFVLVLSAIVVFAPGNNTRETYFPNSGKMGYTIFYTIAGTSYYLLHWSPMLLLMGMTFWVRKARIQSLPFSLSLPIATVVFVFIFALGFAVPSWAMGELPMRRAINILLFIFIMGIFLLPTLLASFTSSEKISFSKSATTLALTLTALSFVFYSENNNYRILISELYNGKVLRYNRFMEEAIARPDLAPSMKIPESEQSKAIGHVGDWIEMQAFLKAQGSK